MILRHNDSRGNTWYFRIDAQPKGVAVVARKLARAAQRVQGSKSAAELSRAILAEAVTIADLQAYNSATVEDWERTAEGERLDC